MNRTACLGKGGLLSGNDLAHLASSLIEDDLDVEDRPELLKSQSNHENPLNIIATSRDTHSKHCSQVGISKSKRYVGYVKTLWLRFGISCGGRSCCCPCWNAAYR
jgi:hypothetical protein